MTGGARSAAAPPEVDRDALERELRRAIQGEVRFDRVSRALYATDASVYQIEPLGVVLPRTRADLAALVAVCARFRCPLTMRGGGTSQAGQAIGAGLVADTSKYLNRLLDVDVAGRRARVEPGLVLDELNAHLRRHGLRFAPDISTASRATVGGMIANNSAGARSLVYGKTIDHVAELDVILSDGSAARFAPVPPHALDGLASVASLEGRCYRLVRELASAHADEIARRYPKILRRVGGYNLDEFAGSDRPFNLAKLVVGSEGTLAVVAEATLGLVPLPRAKAVLVVQFDDLLESLAATPLILRHSPSAVEVMDRFILDHTRQRPALDALRRSLVDGDPGSLLCIEMYADDGRELPPRLAALERDLRAHGFGSRYRQATDAADQARIWSLREAALGLSMAMKGDAKSLSFVEDTAVAPERLRDYIERFLRVVAAHGTQAGVYAHASVGCLHVRPVVDLKTDDGVRTFERIAHDVAGLVLEYGGALSGEHGDGLVRSPFMERMFGPVLYDAFRTIKRTFDPDLILNPGKIVDAEPMTANLRYGAGYLTASPVTYFDYSEYGGFGRAVEMCSGVGACRKTLEGTMCPSYMATRDERDTTRGRANALRLAMAGRLGESGLGDHGVYGVLDLCLECRACRTECPVGVDMARFKSEFLADYWARHGTPLSARVLGAAHAWSKWGSRLAPVSNWALRSAAGRRLGERLAGIDRRRRLPPFARPPLARRARGADAQCGAVLFTDTFTNYYEPDIGLAAIDVLDAAGVRAGVVRHGCCGRPEISKGFLARARARAAFNADALYPHAAAGRTIVFCEPSCLSAVREDAPALLDGDLRARAEAVAGASMLFEDAVGRAAGRLPLGPGPSRILLHGHCHQKSMGLLTPSRTLLSRIPGATVVDLDAGCCGMAGSFGYTTDHFDLSRAIGEHRLFPAVASPPPGTVVVAAGTSCRQQVKAFTATVAVHPAVLLRSLLPPRGAAPQ
jgi:FAD/FMN-containing dehydrogenase/Fe-S oxidoreductase